MNRELKHILTSAINEIKLLRHSNEILAAKVDVVEVFARVTGMRSNYTIGVGEDIAWKIERYIENIEESTKEGK